MLVPATLLAVFALSPCVLGSPVPITQEDSFALAKRAVCGSTKDISPLPIHSHNDYTRNTALCDALANSASSIEADVFWKDNKLFVAHTEIEIKSSRTLQSLYIEPLLSLLNAANPGGVKAGSRPNGFWPKSPKTPLQFLFEFKTDGNDAWDPVMRAFKPLLDAGYLTTFKDGKMIESAITIVGTGKTPLGRVQSQNPRYFFYDAPLTELSPGQNTHFVPTLSPLASADFFKETGWLGIFSLSSSKRDHIRRLTSNAHARGIKVRFWGGPVKVLGIDGPMKAVWTELYNAGVDWMNVDNLTTARDWLLKK